MMRTVNKQVEDRYEGNKQRINKGKGKASHR